MSAAGLGVPPAQEISNSLRAAETRVGARVYEVLPEVAALVLEFLPGRTLRAADVRDPASRQGQLVPFADRPGRTGT